MKILHTYIFLFLLVSLTPLQARLGETEKEIEARYGAPVRKDGLDHYYKFQGFSICVNFKLGKSFFEVYRTNEGTPLHGDAIDVLMRANSLGSTWYELESNDPKRRFSLKSGEAWAVLEADSSKLMIGYSSNVTGF